MASWSVESIAGEAVYLRCSGATPVRSVQPDESKLVFHEYDATGALVGVLSYHPYPPPEDSDAG